MDDEIWARDEVDSPCVKICVIHEGSGICIGCHRTRFEIAGWSRMTAKDRREVTQALPKRAHLLRGARKGRAGRKAVPKL